MDLRALVANLRANAIDANERRLLALTGDREAGIDAAYTAIDAAGVDDEAVCLVTTREGFRYDRVQPDHADQLLGTTRELVVFDCHDAVSANALGQVTGVVEGGGLLLLLLPPLDAVPTALTALVDQVAVPPFSRDAVGTHFRQRLVTTLQQHPGVAIAQLSSTTSDGSRSDEQITIKRDGMIEPAEQPPASAPHVYTDTPFPAAAYNACRTGDQARAVAGLAALSNPETAVVVEADRGRGKSSAAGLAAAALAANGRDVLVTAPDTDNVGELFERATELLTTLGCLVTDSAAGDTATQSQPPISTSTGGQIRFAPPPDAAEQPTSADVVLVDEAAALPVRLLERLLAAPAVGFCTTVHGYEGSGRGFAVRFRERLAASAHDVTDITLEEPIRYARNDPIEAWLAWTLLLDAEPPAEQLVADATPETVSYRRLSAAELAADEGLFRSVVGLLVAAHYKTEPDDIVRLLAAPNLELRVLLHDGHPVSVALLAREGGLDSDRQAAIYRGQRVQGNMLPDVLTSQLRDPTAAGAVGYRVMRIATHHAARSQGLGSALLTRCHEEFDDAVDWIGVGFGATPRLLSFWRANGYRTVHLSMTRNATSGEHSALMLRPCSKAGDDLADRHIRWFRERIGGQLSDTLAGLDPDVVRGAVRAASPPASGDEHEPVALNERGWRVLAGVAYGPGTYAAAPHVFRQLAMAQLTSPIAEVSPREERLLVRKVLQCAPWATVADELGFVSERQCKRAFGAIAAKICAAIDDEGAGEIIAEERANYAD